MAADVVGPRPSRRPRTTSTSASSRAQFFSYVAGTSTGGLFVACGNRARNRGRRSAVTQRVGSLEEGAWPEEADAASLDDGVALGAPVAREVADLSAVSRVTRFCMARVPISSAQPGC